MTRRLLSRELCSRLRKYQHVPREAVRFIRILTKQPNKPQIDQDILVAISVTGNHQQRDDADGYAQICLKFPSADQLPDFLRAQLRVIVVGAQHDCDGTSNCDNDSKCVAFPEGLIQHEGRDYAIRD